MSKNEQIYLESVIKVESEQFHEISIDDALRAKAGM